MCVGGNKSSKIPFSKEQNWGKEAEAKEQPTSFWKVVTAGKEMERRKSNCPPFQNKIHKNPSNRGSHILQGPWAPYHPLAEGAGRRNYPRGPAGSVAHLAIIELLLYAPGNLPEIRQIMQERRAIVCPWALQVHIHNYGLKVIYPAVPELP